VNGREGVKRRSSRAARAISSFASKWCRYPAGSLNPLAKIKIGTCAWSFDDWRGGFYPEHLAPVERLPFYARHFGAVEVDATFYAAPSARTALHWYDVTPPDFIFSCKLTREITHERRLRDVGGLLETFLQQLEPLGEKLGCVLIQLPPSFRPRQDEQVLRAFVRGLPQNVRFAIEFRDHEWHLPRVLRLLEEHRVCWVWTDVTPLDHQAEGAFEFLPQTTDFSYLRLLGDLGRKYGPDGHPLHAYRQTLWPRDASLENWATRLRQRAKGPSRLLVHAANHFEGFAPATARRLATLLELPVLPFPEPAPGQIDLL